MTGARGPHGSPRPQERWLPPSPSTALVPGVLLAFAGLWMVTDEGPAPLGWAMSCVGAALLLVGAIAQGVAWGLDLHADRRG